MLLGRVVERRRRDFTLGRHCARAALRELGFKSFPLLKHASGEPIWPAGVCGSITHCEGHWAAAAARTRDLVGIGIDAEPLQRLSDDVVKIVATPSERTRSRAEAEATSWGVLLFSAKESVFKAWFPLTKAWLDFQDVDIRFEPRTESFRALIHASEHGAGTFEMSGRYRVGERHVFTCAFVEPDQVISVG